ncbi:MAG: energy transducer TonB [Hyphomicrobiaceae bacterium]
MTSGPDRMAVVKVAARWTACALVVGAVHAEAALLLGRQSAPVVADVTSGAFAVDIAPEAVALMDAPKDAPSGPPRQARAASAAVAPPPATPEVPPKKTTEQVSNEPPLPDLPELPGRSDGELPPAPKPEAVSKPAPAAPSVSAPAEAASAPHVVATRTAPVAAAPSIGSPTEAMKKALTAWQSRILDRSERNKRYPAGARRSRHQGTVIVRFKIDRRGRLVHAEIGATSGFSDLDAEAIAILKRATPFPVPPEGLGKTDITLSVPVHFKLR